MRGFRKESEMIDSEKIVEEIRKEIAGKQMTDDLPSFESIPMPPEVSYMGADIADFDMGDLMESNEYINRHFLVSVWHPTGSARRLIGPAIGFFQRIMRKLTRFFVEPIVEDQNAVNMNEVRAINQIRNYIYLDMQALDDRAELIRTIAHQTDELSRRVAALEEENRKLREEMK